jgi:hypothetical protein
MAVTGYSTTAANNSGAPPNGAPEGMAVNAVNDTIRQIMADIAVEAQVGRVKYLNSVAGTNTITGSMSPALTAYSAGMQVVFSPANANTGAATLNIDSLGALDILKFSGSPLVNGDMAAGVPALLVLDSGADDWILINPQTADSTAVGNTAFGFRGLPQNSQSGNYTTVASDLGRALLHPSGAGAGDTFTIDSSLFNTGAIITFINRDSSALTIAISGDTLTLAGTTTTGSRSLAQNGIATAEKDTSGWLISGTGLS